MTVEQRIEAARIRAGAGSHTNWAFVIAALREGGLLNEGVTDEMAVQGAVAMQRAGYGLSASIAVARSVPVGTQCACRCGKLIVWSAARKWMHIDSKGLFVSFECYPRGAVAEPA